MAAKHGKTLKLIAKRLKITKGGKILRRIAGQSHNKAKLPSRIVRIKRRQEEAGKHPLIQRLVKTMHYSPN